MKKVLFIDRDGTLIVEPPDEQVDSLEKLEFIPGVFRNLYKICKLFEYELVIVSNQDGLGTNSYPEDTFWPAHNKMLKAFENEGIKFDNILIDRSRPKDNAPTRKPRTGMLGDYLKGDYDLAGSYVIGDRLTDIELAKNLGAKGILLNDGSLSGQVKEKGLEGSCVLIAGGWNEIFNYLAVPLRVAEVKRKTNETDISVKLNLDGSGISNVSTGLKFFNHMLNQIGRHGGIDLDINVKGDLEVDEHHTVEDTALALGEAFKKALGNKRGIERYGFTLPMDDSLATVAVDFGGRPWLVWNADFKREKVGDLPTEMFMHFFKSFSDAAMCNLNIKAEGQNEHHKIEAIFKSFSKALKNAIQRDPANMQLPTTKGVL
jgi:imidazoleglycerol-phosphate dehydratase/histidinol-phosphatase